MAITILEIIMHLDIRPTASMLHSLIVLPKVATIRFMRRPVGVTAMIGTGNAQGAMISTIIGAMKTLVRRELGLPCKRSQKASARINGITINSRSRCHNMPATKKDRLFKP